MWNALAWPYLFTENGVWAHQTSLPTPPFIEVPVPGEKSMRSCICVLRVWIFLFLHFFLILELLWQCGIFCCSLFMYVLWAKSENNLDRHRKTSYNRESRTFSLVMEHQHCLLLVAVKYEDCGFLRKWITKLLPVLVCN